MRVVLTTIIFIMCFQTQADAQYRKTYRRSGTLFDIRYGLKIGFHNSNFTGDQFLSEIDSDNLAIKPEVDYNGINSFHAGAYIDMRISEQFIFQPEIHYGVFGTQMIRGADHTNPEQNFLVTRSSSPTNIVDVPIERRLTMIQLPLIAKIAFSRSVYLNVGPVISFKLKEKNVYGDIPDSLITLFNFTDPFAPDRFENLMYGGLIGVSYQLENGLNLSLRYNRNFNNINRNENLPLLAPEPKNGTSIITLSAGYTFQYEDRLRQNIGRRH